MKTKNIQFLTFQNLQIQYKKTILTFVFSLKRKKVVVFKHPGSWK